MKKSLLTFRFFLLTFLIISNVSMAAGLNVAPIGFDLSSQHTQDVLTLTNQGDTPVLLEIKPYSWTTYRNKDVYTPTRDIFVSPPIVKIPPHQAQLIRLALQRQPDANQILKYRIYVQEIPIMRKKPGTGVQLLLKLGIPIYVAPLS